MKHLSEEIKRLYIDGCTVKEISEMLEVKQGSLKKFIQRNLKEYKYINIENKTVKKFKKYENIKRLYIKGYNAKEIADYLAFTHKYMREYISENLKVYRAEHIKNRNINKEIVKAVDNTNNSFMSNSSFLNWNRQSYDYNKNGNIVFNEKRGSRVKDVPKTFFKKEGMIFHLEEV